MDVSGELKFRAAGLARLRGREKERRESEILRPQLNLKH